MNIEQGIIDTWAGDATLNGLLPSARVSRGQYQPSAENEAAKIKPVLPYCTFTISDEGPDFQANDDSAADRVDVVLQITHTPDSFDELKVIAERARTVYNRATIGLEDGNQVLTMERRRDFSIQDDNDLTWSWVLEFECLILLPSGT